MRISSKLACILGAVLCACSAGPEVPSSSQTGGGAALGTPTTGGASATGGATTNGGNTAFDGGQETGGTTATGGTSDTGSTGPSGGTHTGGGTTTGGVGGTGDALSGGTHTGGASNTGGATEPGGGTHTGGATEPGGGTHTGGATEPSGGTHTGGGTATGGATNVPGCDRVGLEAAVDSYLGALQAGDPSSMPLAASVAYEENMVSLALEQGLFAAPVTIDFHRNLLDVQRCGSFTEVICASNNPQYVLGVRLQVANSEITEIEVVVTDSDDWLFDADAYLQYSQQEDWAPVPEGARLPYAELQDVGYAYFRYWGDKSEVVPWGEPCARLEGGAYTGDFGSCDVGIPDQDFAPAPYDDLTDVDNGMTVVLLNLGGADSHLFYVLETGIRYVHTLTATDGSM